MTLPTCAIGSFAVSAIGLGCMNLSHADGTPPSLEDGAAQLNHALDLCCIFFDTTHCTAVAPTSSWSAAR